MQHKTLVMKKYLIAILLLVIPYMGLAQIKTVLPAVNSNIPIIVSPASAINITFDLVTIPAGASIDSCKMQLVLNEDIGQKMLLDVRNLSDNKAVFNVGLDVSNKKDYIINITVATKFFNFPTIKSLNIALKTQITNSLVKASFYPADNVSPGNAPRLIVYYHLPATLSAMPVVNWASARADAQHTAQTQNLVKGANPTTFDSKLINDFGDIQTDLVMSNGLVYIVSNVSNVSNVSSKTTLYSIDPVTSFKSVVVDNLPATDGKKTMPVIDAYGRLFYFSANLATAYDLNNNNASQFINIPTGQIITAQPTIGADGSLYLVFGNIIRAYSPYPQLQPIWFYSNNSIGSTVSLNKEGTIAYVIVKDSIVALNTNNGRRINAALLTVAQTGNNPSSTIPLVDIDGNVYVANSLTDATNIDIFDANLMNKKQSISGDHISHMAKGNDGVYFVNGSSLTRCLPETQIKVADVPDDGGVRSLVTDLSGNVYWFGANHFYEYVSAANKVISAPSRLELTLKAMIIAPDASLYVCTSSSLYTFRSHSFDADYPLAGNDFNFINATFRGNNITVPDRFSFSNTQQLTGVNSVTIGSNVTLFSTANITIQCGKDISFNNNFSLQSGAQLSCKTGY